MKERVYVVGLCFILLVELTFSIPFMIDSLMLEGQVTYLYVLVIGHAIWLIFGNLYYLDSRRPIIHYIGLLAFLGSFVPFLGFLLHAIVSFMIIKVLLQYTKRTE